MLKPLIAFLRRRLYRQKSIFRRNVIFSCVLIIIPVVIFLVRVTPYQNRILLDSMESQTQSLAASIAEITVSSIVAEDYSPVVEQCQKILMESPSIRYLIITRREDGFSLVNQPNSWSQENLGAWWSNVEEARGKKLALVRSELTGEDVFEYAFPIVYMNWDWGWIHLGISPAKYRADQAAIYDRTAKIAIISIAVGLVIAFFFSRLLTRPILALNASIRRVEEGDLTARVDIHSGDEVESLATSFNAMADSLQRSRHELTAEKNYTENIIRSLIGMLIVLEPDGRIRSLNRIACELLGYAGEEMLGQSFIAMTHAPQNRTQGEQTLRKLVETGTINSVEETFQARDGTLIPVLISGSVMRENGAIQALVLVAVDITTRKRAEMELEQAHRQLVDASHAAGMAEVATNVLHNVGNVLTSVNVATNIIQEKLARSRVSNLAKAVGMLEAHQDNLADFLTHDPRGVKLPAYLMKLSEHLVEEQEALRDELLSLSVNVDHIKEIVSMQQNYAKILGVLEPVSLADLVEDALRLNAAAFSRHGIQLVREFDKIPPVVTDKHKVLQILVNLVRNAKYAMDENPGGDRILRVGINCGEDALARIVVADNGVGIEPEHMTRLFEHGFTTRANGHGFGLHSCILAAHELGGNIVANSRGRGTGATFILEIPLEGRER